MPRFMRRVHYSGTMAECFSVVTRYSSFILSGVSSQAGKAGLAWKRGGAYNSAIQMYFFIPEFFAL